MDDLINSLLPEVKANLIIPMTDTTDDALILSEIRSALDWSLGYQRRDLINFDGIIAPSTRQAVVMLASHMYESRDGSTAGFFGDNVGASNQVWETIKKLLVLNKKWEV